MGPSDLQNLLNPIAESLGFSHWGVRPLEKPASFVHYQTWLELNHHGEMNYLQTHSAAKENPSLVAPQAQSVLSFAFPYAQAMPGHEKFPLKKNRVAAYAKGHDYHFVFKEKLNVMIESLQSHLPNDEFLAITDSFPLMERDFAARAGLGWFGKNTCLIHPKKGSLFLLCEILTSANFKESSANLALPDFCGTCTRCLEICPTGAIESPRILNATKCISYWTIESRHIPSIKLREKFGDWLFGCDLCQNVCPWNQKIYKDLLPVESILNHTQEDELELEKELQFILTTSGKKIAQWVHGTPLARAGSFGLRRNALVVIGNRKLSRLRPEVEGWLEDERLGQLALWALEKLDVATKNSANGE